MKKVRNQTARVHWRMGQSLLPEHFYGQEESLREELFLRFRLLPFPAWGIGGLKWDPLNLLKGVVSIQEMTLILPSGALIDIPGNTGPASFNLNVTGGARTPIYVHALSEYDVSASEGIGSADEDNVERVVQKIVLSSNPFSDGAIQSFKLAELEKGVDGAWGLAADFIPASTVVGDSPFFENTLRRTRSILTALHQSLVDEIQENYLAGESILGARQCLRALYRLQSFLTNTEAEMRPHPFMLYQAIEELCVDLAVFRETQPSRIDRPYRHEKLGECFDDLLSDLEGQLRVSRASAPYVPFVRKEGLHVCAFPDAAKRARNTFLLLQKPRVATKVDLAGLKLASESRITVVHQRALRGIPYHRIENPPFHHPFSAEVDFYVLSEGEELDHAVREGRIAFFDRPDFQELRAFVYWRTD